MILNALDEVLYWENISLLKDFISEIAEKYYPHDVKGFYNEKERFYSQTVPTKKEFQRRLEYYICDGKPKWVSGRNELSDDISPVSLRKALLDCSKTENGQRKAANAGRIINHDVAFWDAYAKNILYASQNTILELTIGAGLGTTAVMRAMKDTDLYMGVDIDFVCAKNADAIAKYFGVNGLGIATSLWNMPFEDAMFTAVCSNAGLEECREIPTIMKEASRVLAPSGRMILHCIRFEKSSWRLLFSKYGFTDDETRYWLKKARLYSDVEQIEELASDCGLRMIGKQCDAAKGYIMVFEK